MRSSLETNEIAAALAKAQGAFRTASKSNVNPHFKTRYASLADLMEAVRQPLSDNGLAIVQAPDMRREAFVLVTRLTHASGQWFESLYPLPTNGGPQQLGSAITYARRYALAAMLSVAADEDEDDDGEVAKDATASVKRPPKQYRPDPEVALARLKKSIDAVPDLDLLLKWRAQHEADLSALPDAERAALGMHYKARKLLLSGGVTPNGANGHNGHYDAETGEVLQ